MDSLLPPSLSLEHVPKQSIDELNHGDHSSEVVAGRKGSGKTTLDEFIKDLNHGDSQCVVVAGVEGSGKTTLVQNIHKQIVRQTGLLRFKKSVVLTLSRRLDADGKSTDLPSIAAFQDEIDRTFKLMNEYGSAHKQDFLIILDGRWNLYNLVNLDISWPDCKFLVAMSDSFDDFRSFVEAEVNQEMKLRDVESLLREMIKQRKEQTVRASDYFNQRRRELLLRVMMIKQRMELPVSGSDLFSEDQLESVLKGVTKQRDLSGEGQIKSLFREMIMKHVLVWELTVRDSLDLFRSFARDVDHRRGSLAIQKMLTLIPMRILAVSLLAKALRNENSDWNSVLRDLKQYGDTIEFIIWYSFRRLPRDDQRLCLIYCCSYPEDHDIDLDEIIPHGVGEGFFKGKSFLDVVADLKNSGLLIAGKSKGHVKVHNLVKTTLFTNKDLEFATPLRQEYIKTNAVVDEDKNVQNSAQVSNKNQTDKTPLEDLPFLANMYGRSVTNANLMKIFDGKLEKKLLTILLQNNTELTSLPDNFFEDKKDVRVLDLSCTGITSLPPSTTSLKELRTLCLNHLTLSAETVSGLAELLSLQALSLNSVAIDKLPQEFKKLTKLKLLDLTHTKIKTITPNIIAELVELEHLYMLDSFDEWKYGGVKSSKELASIDELKHLKKLCALHICVKNPEAIFREEVVCDLKKKLSSLVIWTGETCRMMSDNHMRTIKYNSLL